MNQTPRPAVDNILNFDRRRADVGPPRGQADRRKTGSGRRATDALKMSCHNCGCSESAVLRSRGSVAADEVRRRRQCVECNEIFPTYERLDIATLERERADSEVSRQLMHALPPANWPNAEALLHRVWSQSKDGRYEKEDWNTLQQILTELKRIPAPVPAEQPLPRVA